MTNKNMFLTNLRDCLILFKTNNKDVNIFTYKLLRKFIDDYCKDKEFNCVFEIFLNKRRTSISFTVFTDSANIVNIGITLEFETITITSEGFVHSTRYGSFVYKFKPDVIINIIEILENEL